MRAETWLEYRPAWAAHVVGRYSKRIYDSEAGSYEPQSVSAVCEVCREHFGPIECRSGQPLSHVDKFAVGEHLHRDRMAPRPIAKLTGPP